MKMIDKQKKTKKKKTTTNATTNATNANMKRAFVRTTRKAKRRRADQKPAFVIAVAGTNRVLTQSGVKLVCTVLERGVRMARDSGLLGDRVLLVHGGSTRGVDAEAARFARTMGWAVRERTALLDRENRPDVVIDFPADDEEPGVRQHGVRATTVPLGKGDYE